MGRQLGNLEHALTITDQFAPFNVVVVLRLVNGPDPDVLRQALALLQRRHPLLRMRIRQQSGRFYFDEMSPVTAVPLQILPRQDGARWQAVTEEALNTNLDIVHGPLLRCWYLYQSGAERPVELILSTPHVIIDGAAGLRFYHELLSLCAGDSPFNPMDELPLLPAAEQFFPPQAQGGKRFTNTLRLMRNQIADEIQYRRQLGDGRRAPIHAAARCAIVPRTLSTAVTTTLTRQTRRRRITMNSVLSAAMLLAVHRHLYQNHPMPQRAMMFANMRPYLTPPVANEQLGCYMSMWRHTVSLSTNTDVWVLAGDLQQKTVELTRRGQKFLLASLSKQLMKMGIRWQAFRLATTAISYAGPVNLQPAYGLIQVDDLRVFISNNRLGPEFTAFAKILFDRLSWDFIYLDSDMDQALAQTIADEVCAILS